MAAADLLQWLDARGGPPVMSVVLEQLGASGAALGAGSLRATSAAVCLPVDVTALMCDDAGLATALLQRPGEVAVQAACLINQQLACCAETDAAASESSEAPSIRLSLQLTQVPLPLSTVAEVAEQVVRSSSGSSSAVPVSLIAVVSGLAPPHEAALSRRFKCHQCGSLADVGEDQGCLPCCGAPRHAWLQEDVTGRVQVAAQQAWVSELSSALGRNAYGVSRASLLLHLPEAAVGTCHLGQVVHVIGHASSSCPGAGGHAACGVQVAANSCEPVLPHFTWLLPPAGGGGSAPPQPLQHMWEALVQALGYEALDPHVSLALLLSAAAVGGDRGGGQQSEQVSVLVLHEAFAPATPRLLREAAALLSPQSVAMPMRLAEHVTPITGGSSGSGSSSEQGKAVFASLLHATNTGIATADLGLLPSKARTQLLDALACGTTPQPRDAQHSPAPLSATVWAAAAWQDVCPGEGEAGRGGKAAATAQQAYQGFDLCLGDGTVHEDDLWCSLDAAAALASAHAAAQAAQLQARASLRHLVAAAAMHERPVLTDAAQTFLGCYFLMLRQGLDSGSRLSRPHLLGTLVRVASAVARLHRRTSVLECPDATAAVVLMELSLANKLGAGYQPLLELPADLCPANGRSLDDQLAVLHGIISRAFRQHQGGGSGGGGWGWDGPGGEEAEVEARPQGSAGGDSCGFGPARQPCEGCEDVGGVLDAPEE